MRHFARLDVRTSVLSIITGGGKWVEITIPMDPLYLSVLVSAEKKFWRCAKSELKALMPEDAREAIGHGVKAKRATVNRIQNPVLPVLKPVISPRGMGLPDAAPPANATIGAQRTGPSAGFWLSGQID
jgi:hypothetical protein